MLLPLHMLVLLSGAAGLIYQVAWARSLGLVFGGSHLAVTTVLSIFMGGLALGAALFGGAADRSARPLRLYGLLEVGIALSSATLLLLPSVYPALYQPLARVAEENRFYLTAVRVLLASLGMLLPTTLMGGTLPALTRAVVSRPDALRPRLSALYAANTFGAVAGTLGAGFVLLPGVGLSATILVAMGANLFVGLAALLLDRRRRRAEPSPSPSRSLGPQAPLEGGAGPPGGDGEAPPLAQRLVLWGIGLSGFCALGYEVLWTRMLAFVVGTTVYGFALMLSAFLLGIALGSAAFAASMRRSGGFDGRRAVSAFAGWEAAIGVAALATSVLLGQLPELAPRLQSLMVGRGLTEFGARQTANFALAFAYVFAPALLLGVVFPLAAAAHASFRQQVGAAVGRVYTVNTMGSVLGAAVTGFALIQLLGLERALLTLVALNLGLALMTFAALRGRRQVLAAGALTAIGLALIAAGPGPGVLWDSRRFALHSNNARDPEGAPGPSDHKLRSARVLYYFEGDNETISVFRPIAGEQYFVVNGRTEATTVAGDMQCQQVLGHLPMLLHPNPRKVFVLGAGAGVTLGAVSVHPEVESVVLAEIEPGALGATRTFAEHNHHALDNPKLHIVFNDGRNYLATTRNTFDVITADPIHPWSGGASYLYTQEYFRAARARLRPGGVMAQWLPIYELTPEDIATVLRTFSATFRHVVVWLTLWDAEIVGSDAPFLVDQAALARRFATPKIQADLAAVGMPTPEAFLSYFLMADGGARAFGESGRLNTDDNLFLEFSAPRSVGRPELLAANVRQLVAHRESIGVILRREGALPAERILALDEAARWVDQAHVLALAEGPRSPRIPPLLAQADAAVDGYSPAAFLRRIARVRMGQEPLLLAKETFAVRGSDGQGRTIDLALVGLRPSERGGLVVVVDNGRRQVLGEVELLGDVAEVERGQRASGERLIASLRAAYQASAGGGAPEEAAFLGAIGEVLRAHPPPPGPPVVQGGTP